MARENEKLLPENKKTGLEYRIQGRKTHSVSNLDEEKRLRQEYLSLAMLFRTSVDIVKDNYDTLVQQCKEAGIVWRH